LDESNAEWSVRFDVAKIDVEKRHVYGWLSVAEDAEGKLIIDKQGDFILPEDLERTAKDFMLSSRAAGEMHERIGVGKVFESMVFTREKLEKLGLDGVPVGWWIGAEVAAGDEAWERVKSGQLQAWSIGGSGRRIDTTIVKFNPNHDDAGRFASGGGGGGGASSGGRSSGRSSGSKKAKVLVSVPDDVKARQSTRRSGLGFKVIELGSGRDRSLIEVSGQRAVVDRWLSRNKYGPESFEDVSDLS
jgi:hypothetical protein